MPRERLFLERQSYRLRRMMDAIRLLPVLGLCLWIVPVLWPVADAPTGEPMPTSAALRYIFGIWLCLCAAAWFLWRRTRHATESDFEDAGTSTQEPH